MTTDYPQYSEDRLAQMANEIAFKDGMARDDRRAGKRVERTLRRKVRGRIGLRRPDPWAIDSVLRCGFQAAELTETDQELLEALRVSPVDGLLRGLRRRVTAVLKSPLLGPLARLVCSLLGGIWAIPRPTAELRSGSRQGQEP